MYTYEAKKGCRLRQVSRFARLSVADVEAVPRQLTISLKPAVTAMVEKFG